MSLTLGLEIKAELRRTVRVERRSSPGRHSMQYLDVSGFSLRLKRGALNWGPPERPRVSSGSKFSPCISSVSLDFKFL